LREIAEDLDALSIRSDIADPQQSAGAMAEIEEALGGIDVLFVNAGVGGFAAVDQVTEEFWTRSMTSTCAVPFSRSSARCR
jgi:NAD(P)-dependent dehydrogenase (short-subunit alcohol dehydrogenase family)